jgi:hypothetical protein
MSFCRAAALALVGWYLVHPPVLLEALSSRPHFRVGINWKRSTAPKSARSAYARSANESYNPRTATKRPIMLRLETQ